MTRPRPSPMAIALIALMILISAGCSQAADTADTAGTGDRAGTAGSDGTHDQAVAFAECMRNNGVSGFPDPDASGELTIDAIANGTSVDPSSAGFEQARGACKGLEPAGFTGEERDTDEQEAALAFAQCIRDNGVADFPDPTPGSPLVDTNKIPSLAEAADLSVLDAAMATCGDLIADLLAGQ